MKDYSVEELKELSLYEFCKLFWSYDSDDYWKRVSEVTDGNVNDFLYEDEENYHPKYIYAFNMHDYVVRDSFIHKDNIEELCNFIEKLPSAVVDKIFEEIRQGGSQWSKNLSG